MKIVVGHHETPQGTAAMARAVTLAEDAPDSEVHLVRYAPLPAEEEDPQRYVAQRAKEQQDTEALVQGYRERGLTCEAHHVHDAHDAATAILQVAQQVGADLVVIGMRRRSRVGKLVFGSTAQTILLDSDCPVLSVKSPRAD